MAVDPRVRFLRENQTHTERLLWAQLRKKRVGSLRFRRQYPIGDYIVDFVCLSARLIVEVDGDSHDMTVARDKRRSHWLEEQGFRILRFSNREVLENLEGVTRMIGREVSGLNPSSTPSPHPPPARGGGIHKGSAGR